MPRSPDERACQVSGCRSWPTCGCTHRRSLWIAEAGCPWPLSHRDECRASLAYAMKESGSLHPATIGRASQRGARVSVAEYH